MVYPEVCQPSSLYVRCTMQPLRLVGWRLLAQARRPPTSRNEAVNSMKSNNYSPLARDPKGYCPACRPLACMDNSCIVRTARPHLQELKPCVLLPGPSGKCLHCTACSLDSFGQSHSSRKPACIAGRKKVTYRHNAWYSAEAPDSNACTTRRYHQYKKVGQLYTSRARRRGLVGYSTSPTDRSALCTKPTAQFPLGQTRHACVVVPNSPGRRWLVVVLGSPRSITRCHLSYWPP